MAWPEFTFTVTDPATGEVIDPSRTACSEGNSPIHLARAVYVQWHSRALKIQVSNRDRIWDYEMRLFPWPDDTRPRRIMVWWHH